MTLISYLSMPVVSDSGVVQYVRIDLAKEKVMVKMDHEYQEVEDIQSIANDVDMFLRFGENYSHDHEDDHEDDCECCDK